MSKIPTWDLEAIGWTYPISIGFYDGYHYHEFLRQGEDDDIVWRFLEFVRQFEGIKLFAHCASRYDNLFILHTLCKHDEPLTLEAGMAKLKWVGPNITFEDSYLLAPMKLSKLNKMLGVEEKKEWDHEQTLRPWEMGEKLQTFRAYQRTDCLSLSESMSKLAEEIGRNFGVAPSMTLATTAAKTISKCFFNLDGVESNEYVEEFIRDATYGARNEIYKRYGENIYHYDIHDMYTSCYDVPVPIGELHWTRPDLDTATWVEATVKVPEDCYIGPLPYREQERLIFPRGEFTGSWDAREIRNAVKKFNIDLTIRRQLTGDEAPILATFGKFMNKLREESDLSRYWKLFGVSPSGKFGQSRWRDITRHVSAIKDFKGKVPIDKDELYFRSIEYTKGRAPYIKPAITMRIRAEARIRHLDYMVEAKQHGDIFYCDTDSAHCHHQFPIIEKPDSGELAYLGKAERGYFIRQKLYGLIIKGALIQRSAGYSDLKLDEDDFKYLLKGGEVEFEAAQLPNYRQLLTTGDLKRLEGKRVISAAFLPNRETEGNDSRPILLPRPEHHQENPTGQESKTSDDRKGESSQRPV